MSNVIRKGDEVKVRIAGFVTTAKYLDFKSVCDVRTGDDIYMCGVEIEDEYYYLPEKNILGDIDV